MLRNYFKILFINAQVVEFLFQLFTVSQLSMRLLSIIAAMRAFD